MPKIEALDERFLLRKFDESGYDICQMYRDLAEKICQKLKESRRLSLALTNLEQSLLWALVELP